MKARKRWPRFPVTCTVCKKLRYCTPLYPTTKEERAEMARTYVCTDHPTPPPICHASKSETV